MKNYFKNSLVALPLVLGMSLAPLAANAGESKHNSNMKIAVLDSQKMVEESKAVKSIKEQVNKKIESFKNEAAAKEKEITKKFQDLESNKQKLSKEAYESEREKLAKEAEEFQKKGYEERMQIEKASAEAMEKVEKVFYKIVEEKAKKSHYNLVLFKMSTIYNDANLDITAQVLKDLDKELPKVAVKFAK